MAESAFHLYTEIFVNVNFRVSRSLFHYNLDIFQSNEDNRNEQKCCYYFSNKHWTKMKRYLLGLSCLLVAFPLHLNPLVKMLQFLMSVLTFSNFLKKYGIMHESTEACDNAIAGAPGIDSTLAIFTSLLAWWMLFPAIYTMAKVVTPDGAAIPEKFMPHKYKMHNDEVGKLNQKMSMSSSNTDSEEVDVRRIGPNIVLNSSSRDNNSSATGEVYKDSFRQVGVLIQNEGQETDVKAETDESHHLRLMGRRLYEVGDEWEYYAMTKVIKFTFIVIRLKS